MLSTCSVVTIAVALQPLDVPTSAPKTGPPLSLVQENHACFILNSSPSNTLTKDEIIEDILDMEHYKDYMKSLIRVFKTPSIMGFKPTYKSDYIWVTVEAPPKLWNEDLNQELYTALAGYVTSEVSRTITVRVVEARDEWVTRVLVVGGGISGLTSSLSLAEQGMDVTLVEREKELGGNGLLAHFSPVETTDAEG